MRKRTNLFETLDEAHAVTRQEQRAKTRMRGAMSAAEIEPGTSAAR